MDDVRVPPSRLLGRHVNQGSVLKQAVGKLPDPERDLGEEDHSEERRENGKAYEECVRMEKETRSGGGRAAQKGFEQSAGDGGSRIHAYAD